MPDLIDYGNGLKGYEDITQLENFNVSALPDQYVYTTFNNSKYNLAGNVRHEITTNIDISDKHNNTATCTELETVRNINMFYGISVNSNSLAYDLFSGGTIQKYTNLSEHEIEIYNSGNGGVNYIDYNSKSNDNLPTNNIGYSYSYLKLGVLTEIDRTQLQTIAEFIVSKYDSENNRFTNVQITQADYPELLNWLENDTSGIFQFQGSKCIVTIQALYITPITTSNINSALKYNGNNIHIYPLCERYAENNIFYYKSSYYSKTSMFAKIPYDWANTNINNYTFPTYSYVFTSSNLNGSVTSIKNSAYNTISKSIEENTDFNTLYTFIDNAFEFDYNTGSIEYTNRLNPIYLLRDDNVVLIYARTTNVTGNNNSMSLHLYKPVSGREYMATLGALLMPFMVTITQSTPNRTGNRFIGVRESDGTYIGNWVPYTDPSQVETEFRPDDFTPVDSEEEYNNVRPEQPDDATKRTGDSQNLTAPVNLIGCAGFLTNYIMTNVNMQNFGQSLWASFNDSAFWQSLGAVFSDSLSVSPSDVLKYIVSLRCYPINLWELERTAVDRLYIGRGTSGIDIGVGLSYTTEMTMFKSCGSVTVPAHYGNYLDYYPYTQVSIYLPFCGEFELSATEVVGSSLTVHYAIDFTTGMCTAWVLSSSDGVEYIVLSASGQIGQDIQITAGNLSQVALSIASAGLAGIQSARDFSKENDFNSTYTGEIRAGISGFVQNFKTGLFPSSVLPNPSFTSFYAPMTPYLKIKSSRVSKPANWGSTSGNVAQRSVILGSMSGFVQCVNPDVSGIPATETELAEIRAMLEHGVYV